MNFAQVKAITIPAGSVKQLAQGQTVLWKQGAPVPQRIEFGFLRSFGDCAIDTGAGNGVATSSLGVKCKHFFRPTASGQWLFNAALSNGNALGLQSTGTESTALQAGDGTAKAVNGKATGGGSTFQIANGKIASDWNEATMENATLASNLSLFGTATPGDFTLGDIEPVKISAGGVTLADLQPCVVNGVPAMYDKVSGQYRYASGSGRLHACNYARTTGRGSMGSNQLQGMAIYGDIAVRMANSTTSTTHRVYRLTSSGVTEIATFTMSGCGHANALQFAGTLEAGQTLPYMSVSDLDGHCYVLEFNSSYQATKVQTITLSVGAGQVLKDDNNYVWSSWTNTNGNRHFRKYRQVLVSEGASVTLTDADILDEWDTWETFPSTYFTFQGWKVKGGRLYLLYGGAANNATSIRGVTVYDTATHHTVDQYDFTDYLYSAEPEDLDFYDGNIVIGLLTGNLQSVEKVVYEIPAGYTQVQYVVLTGTQNIDLLIYGNEGTDALELDAALTTVSAQMRLIASTSANCQTYVNGSLGLGYRHANSWKGLSGVTFDTSRHRSGVDYVNKVAWFDGTQASFTGTSTNNTGSAYLGVGLQYSTQPRLKAYVYGARAWRYGFRIRDIIFLRDENYTPYAYDIARNAFRTISGTVTLGPDV